MQEIHPLDEAVDQVRRRPEEIRQIQDNRGQIVAVLMSKEAFEQLGGIQQEIRRPSGWQKLTAKSRKSRKERKRRAEAREREAERERERIRAQRRSKHTEDWNRKHRPRSIIPTRLIR